MGYGRPWDRQEEATEDKSCQMGKIPQKDLNIGLESITIALAGVGQWIGCRSAN